MCLATQLHIGFSQSLKFKNFSLKNGLSHSTVFRVTQQGTTGLLWFGTDYGLSRYDGYEFINFTYNQPVSLNSVLAIAELNKDSLLVSFYREGMYIFSNGKLFPINSDENVDEYDKIVTIVKGDNCFYAVSTSKAVYQYKNDTLTQVNPVYKNKSIYPTCIAYSQKQGLLLGTPNGLYAYKSNTTTKLEYPELQNRRIDDIQANREYTWIASNNKVFKLANSKISIAWELSEKCQHSIIHIDYRGYIWRATPQQGIWVKMGEKIIDINKTLGIENEVFNCIEEDWEGNLWIGTQSNGVYCISISEYATSFIQHNKQKLPYATAVLSTKNNNWIASQGKLYKTKNLVLERINKGSKSKRSKIYNLFEDNEGRILASTPNGILVWNDKNKTFKIIDNANDGAIAFCYNNKNKLIVSSFKGLFTLENDSLIPFKNSFLNVGRFNALVTDKVGFTWLGSEKGLYKTKNGKVILIKNSIKVFDLLIGKNGVVWAATNQGVFTFNGDLKKQYTSKEGLPHNLCKVLEEDKEGKIWAGTLKGLGYYEKTNDVFYPYDIQPFEAMDEILALSITGDDLLVGTIGDAYKLKLKIPVCNPGIVISKVIVGDSVFYAPTPFTLPYKSNSFSVYYSSIAIAYGQQLRYETKLLPIDTGWNTTTNNNLNFKNLPPGDYTFSVRVRNHANGEVSRTEKLKFSVFTPFWQKKWFLISTVLLSLSIAIITHRVRLRILRDRDLKKSKIEQQLLYLKMQAMNALMNPHFISNVLHSIISYLEHLKPGETVDDKYIAYFSELIRLNLINSDKSYIALRDELRRLELYILLEQFRFKDKFDFDIIVDASIDKENIEIPNMLIQPFVENAINHGLLPAKHNGKLTVSIDFLSADIIEISITDNGIGINTSKNKKIGIAHRSMGIKLVRERMESAQQTRPILIEDISLYNDGETGTKVTIILEV